MDRAVARLFRLKGDFIPDFRLLDYMTTLMSHPTLPGPERGTRQRPRLKRELASMGVFHESCRPISLQAARLRDHGLSGFEGRFYSLFDSLDGGHEARSDPAAAPERPGLQVILSAASRAPRYGHARGRERAAADIFRTAISLPTVLRAPRLGQRLSLDLVSGADRVAAKPPLSGHVRPTCQEYRLALLDFIEREGADLVRNVRSGGAAGRLRARILDPRLRGRGPSSRGASWTGPGRARPCPCGGGSSTWPPRTSTATGCAARTWPRPWNICARIARR